MRLEKAHPIPSPIFSFVKHVASDSVANLKKGGTKVLGKITDDKLLQSLNAAATRHSAPRIVSASTICSMYSWNIAGMH